MSVILKSNNVLNNIGLGQVKMLGTTAQAKFDAYKARVLADGGTIKDEARTLSAFKLLFDNKMYGNMDTAVSGTFGVKVDANGGLTKLYAIDGVDLIGVTYGTGTLPTLDTNNNIVFANSVAQNTNGGMFVSESKLIASKVGNFGFLITAKAFITSQNQRIAALTKHNDVANTQMISAVMSYTTGEVAIVTQTDPFTLTATPTFVTTKAQASQVSYPPIVFMHDAAAQVIAGSRSGAEVVTASGKAFAAITTEDFYIDFGGEYHSDKKYFANATVRDMFCFAHATREQAVALSAFSQ